MKVTAGYASTWHQRATVAPEVAKMAIHGRYPSLRDALLKDEAALLTVFEAHTAVRHRCREGECEARQVLDDALGRIQELLAAEVQAGS
jgi:hypothetical protein